MKKSIFGLLIILIALVSSCVSQKKYTDLEDQHSKTKGELVDSKAELQSALVDNVHLVEQSKSLKEDYNRIIFQDIKEISEDLEKSVFDVVDIEKTEVNDCSADGLDNLKDLTGGLKKFLYVSSQEVDAKAKFLVFFKINVKSTEKFMISDFVQYKDVNCSTEPSKSLRYAVGVRLILKTSNKDSDLELNIPSQVAAAVELKMTEVSYTIETIGFASKEMREILADLKGSFDVDAYSKVIEAQSKIIKAMNDEMDVDPIKIPI